MILGQLFIGLLPRKPPVDLLFLVIPSISPCSYLPGQYLLVTDSSASAFDIHHIDLDFRRQH
jgi:hypothetical protein